MPALLRHPLLHFLLLGGLLFGLEQWLFSDTFEAEPVVIDDAIAQHLSRDWQRETGREPNTVELRATLHRHLQDERLVKEALRLGLAEGDPVVRARLIENLRFIDPDRPHSDAQLFREAVALGMVSQDVVTRRRLIHRMSQQLTGDIAVDPVALNAHIAAHPDRYGAPPRYRLSHRFVANDPTPQRALALRDALNASTDPTPLGDPFLLGDLPTWTTQAELHKVLGSAVAGGLEDAEEGVWTPPLPSAWGWHLIRVDATQRGTQQDPADLRRRAAYAWLAERERELLVQAQHILASRYPVDWRVTAIPTPP